MGATRAARQFSSPDFANYQGVILAEFVVAELLVAGTPIATRQNQPGLSPYIPRDMTKMLSIGMVYFLLELMAVGNARWGRIGAWFGGLVLLAVGLGEAASVAKVLDIFGTGLSNAANGPSGTDTTGFDGSGGSTAGQNPLPAPSGLVQPGGSSSLINPNQALGR